MWEVLPWEGPPEVYIAEEACNLEGGWRRKNKNRKMPGCRHEETPGGRPGGQESLAAAF